jgi:glycosyltransferase involved in cell wall biosynthesis
MLVSIIIPTFNRLELLKRAIDSVEKQSFQDYELIIVDDASEDDSLAYLDTVKHTVIKLSTNMGVSSARDEGVKVAKGELIAFLDSDDVWCHDKLQTQVAFYHSREDIRCTFGVERWFRKEKEVKRPKKYKAPLVVHFDQLLEFTFIGPSSVMLEKSLYSYVGGFDRSLAVCEDFDLWLRITTITPMYLCEESVIEKHAHDKDQLSTSVLTLEPYRVKALMKHAARPKVKEMIQSKLAIIHKGAKKHNNQELLDFVKEHDVF